MLSLQSSVIRSDGSSIGYFVRLHSLYQMGLYAGQCRAKDTPRSMCYPLTYSPTVTTHAASLPSLTLAAGPHVPGPHLAAGPTLTAGFTLAATLDFIANFTLEQ